MAHLTKAAIPLERSTDWLSPDIKSAVRVVADAHDTPLRLEDFRAAGDLLWVICTSELKAVFGRVAF